MSTVPFEIIQMGAELGLASPGPTRTNDPAMIGGSHARSRRVFVCLLLLLAIGLPASVPAQEEWSPDLSLQVKRVSEVRVSPEGDHLLFLVAVPEMDDEQSAWRSHIHVARADGSSSVQFTQGAHSASAPAWSPDGSWIAFLSSRSGIANVWRIALAGGEAQQVTNADEAITAFQWSPDGTHIAYTRADSLTAAEERARKEGRDVKVIGENVKRIGLYVMGLEGLDVEAQPERRLSPAEVSVGAWSGQPFDWSPDGSEIVFTHKPGPGVNDWPKADLSVVEVETGRVRTLASTAAAESDPHYSPDGRWIAYTASDSPVTWAFTQDVHVVPSEGGTPRPLAHTFDRGAGIVGWGPDARSLIISETERTVRRLASLPVNGDPPADLSPPGLMVGSPALNWGRTHVGFVSQAVDRAPEAYMATVEPFRSSQVSRVQNGSVPPVGRTEVISWRSPDGTDVEGLLTYPPDYAEGTRVPTLVIVHGGPTGVFTQDFIGAAGQYPVAVFAQRGYAVLRPNPRGSGGYGREFRYANYGDWGGGDYQDIMAGVDHLIARGIADPDALGVMGWSYGGFMTSWVITQTDRFRAASVGAGLPNLISFTGTSDVPGFVPDYFGGEFWEGKEVWEAHSPMSHMGGVSTPTLIQHGEEDDRVPVSQAYELYNALDRQGVATQFAVYPRQGHGIREPNLLRDVMQRNLDWFERWVLGGGPRVP